jgi:WD40 repeat protein
MKTQNNKTFPLVRALAALGIGLATIHQASAAGCVSVSPMNKAGSSHTATLLPNGKMLVTGGGQDQTSAELYDPATDIWTLTGALRAARGGHTATLLPNGKVLVAGGASGTSTELYDPATGTWTRRYDACSMEPHRNVAAQRKGVGHRGRFEHRAV